MNKGSQIFELYGYPVDSWNSNSAANLSECKCPFMNAECDGGGNRFSSGIILTQHHPLSKYFRDKKQIQAGVCSLQLHEGEQPWIVCPRRLLNYRHCGNEQLQRKIKKVLCEKSELNKGIRYNVWSEVKMKCSVVEGDEEGLFDYTFDYVIAGKMRKRLSEIAKMVGKSVPKVRDFIEENGFTPCFRDGEWWCDDFPSMPLVIVEVMTSSTCGGNKKKRTQISQVFEDTVYRLNGRAISPTGPGINYRQVWARMVSQLLVKSQIGMAWGGSTFWILQDLLVDYISKTTALNLSDFLASRKGEVNIISGGYGDNVEPSKRKGEFALVEEVKLYSGPVSSDSSFKKSFSDIIKLGGAPDIAELWKKLIQKKPCGSFVC